METVGDKRIELLLERGARHLMEGRVAPAIRAFADVIGDGHATPRAISIAAFNRGLMREEIADVWGAFDDWSLVLETAGAPLWIRGRTWLARGILRRKADDTLGAICDYTAAMQDISLLPTHVDAAVDSRVEVPAQFSPVELKGHCRWRRAAARLDLGDLEGAMGDALDAMRTPGLSPETRARVASIKACILLLQGRFAEAAEVAQRTVGHGLPLVGNRLIAALALLAQHQIDTAVQEFKEGLAGVRVEAGLDDIEEWLVKIETMQGPLGGAELFRGMLREARETLAQTDASSPAAQLNRLNMGWR